MASSEYRVTVPEESVMAGNSALLKCSIPSFVADFLSVTAWIDSEGVELSSGLGHAVGNVVLQVVYISKLLWWNSFFSPCEKKELHCLPYIILAVVIVVVKYISFSAVGQPFASDVSPEYAIAGNDAIFKCKLPSFVADFVSVVSWIDSESNSVFPNNNAGMTMSEIFVWKKQRCNALKSHKFKG